MSLCLCKRLKSLPQHLQELIRNKAKNGQNCCLLEEAYAMVSALPQRSENTHHVSMIENYPATLEVLGEPIRQVGGLSLAFQHPWLEAWLWLFICVHFFSPFWNQGPFQVWEGAPGIRTSSRGHHRHVFLFKNYCIICKPKRESNTDTQAYVFKNMMKVIHNTATAFLYCHLSQSAAHWCFPNYLSYYSWITLM